jgi:CO dehydrogenase maturation factor
MSCVIAMAGKGGVGKTTVSALVVRYFTKHLTDPVLAIDADPNSNLGETLGMSIEKTVGDIREDFMKDPQGVPSGMDKVLYLEMLMNQVLIEQKNFDLLVMGRQEGQGCYCMVNNILNRFADELESNYKYLLVDNEAGMEHLSRRTSGKVDMLLMVTDYALRGLRAVGRINDMLADLKLDVRQKGLVVNRAPETLNQAFLDEVEQIGVPLLCTIPQDDNLLEFDMERRSMLELPDDSPAVLAVDSLMEKVLQKVVA